MPMKILLITDLYPVKESETTTPRTLYDFVQGWTEMGHTIKIIKPNFILNSFIRKKPFYKTGWYGDVFNVNYWLPFCGNVKRKLKKYYEKSFEPDVVIAHMPSGILFADKLGIPFAAGVHCSDMKVLTDLLYFYLWKRMWTALEHAEKIFCRSHCLLKKFKTQFPEFSSKTFNAPSGIDESIIIDDFTHEINQEKLKVITCANFKKRKNIDKLIRAVKYMDGVELTIIGDGERRKTLEKISDKPIFTGRLPHDQVLKLMRESDIFILPSVNETFGMVYLEAMASGCITVGIRDDGIDGIIQNGVNGFLIKPKTSWIKSLIEDIKSMEKEELEKIRKESLRLVRRHTRKISCEKYLEQLIQTEDEN